VISQAFVLGAGLGTRLKALTQNYRPKPLIPVANRPLITYAFDHLRSAGVTRFVVNTHWRAEAYSEAFPQPVYEGLPLVFRHEWPEVLETAGGIKNVEDLLGGQPFWVYNGDILSNLPLAPAVQAHQESGNEVTLVLRSKDGPLQISFDPESKRIADIGGRLESEREPAYLFTGIYLVNPAFFARIPAATKLSVIQVFCDMIRSGDRLGGIVIDDGDWYDLGTRDQYLAVHESLGNGPWIDPTARIASDAVITGASAISANAVIGPGARIHNSLVWDRAEVEAGAELFRCIVATGQRASGKLSDQDIA
jgi:NDP-sugar pyrophosphorylase family protein